MRASARTAVLLTGLLACGTASARADEAARPIVVETADERRIEARLIGLHDGRLLAAVDGRERAFPLEDVVGVEFGQPDGDEIAPPRSMVFLANGDRLGLRPLTADEDALHAEWAAIDVERPLEVPLETVQGIAWGLPRDAATRDTIERGLRTDPAAADVATLEGGDRIAGAYAKLLPDALHLEVAGVETSLPIEKLRSLRFDPALVAFPDLPEERLLVRLRDGSLITAADVTVGGEESVVEAVFGRTFVLPTSVIASLQTIGGPAVSLSDREPVEAETTPLIGPPWPLQRDRSVVGFSLRIGDEVCAKGLGVHAPSRVAYELDGAFGEFRATVGIDASAGEGGSAVFVVRVDDREAFRSDVLRGGDDPVPIAVDVRDAERLELIVEPADRGDVLDRANWCGARVVRPE